jgi:predicted alpha/beta superfamily hydrolase
MRGRPPLRAALAALLLLAPSLGAQATPPAPPPDPVPAHDSFTVASRVLGEGRPINVHVPAAYRASPAERFAVLYMPDGGIDEDFPHVVNTVDSLVARGEIGPVIVVGIPNTQRRRDLTGPTRIKSDSAIAPRVGGSAAFRQFIRDELIPLIEARYRTTKERTIVGESLAGLFVVETFLLEPSLFDRYIAFDPSLWWNAGALVDAASRHLARLGTARRTLYLTSSSQDIDAQTTRLAGVLRASAPRSLTWTHMPRPDLTHATIFRGEAPRALGFALASGQAPGPAPGASQAPSKAITYSLGVFAGQYARWLTAAFDAIPADKYGFKPTPPQQTIGYIAQHLEEDSYGLCAGFGAIRPPMTARDSLAGAVKATWPKDTLVARFKASLGACQRAFEALDDTKLAEVVPLGRPGSGQTGPRARAVVGFVTDLASHWTQIANYMRLLGMVPPSALPPPAR